jgi:hypothetical protein
MIKGHPGVTLTDAMNIHLVEMTPPAGRIGEGDAVLNPRFVEALMGFPKGWIE